MIMKTFMKTLRKLLGNTALEIHSVEMYRTLQILVDYYEKPGEDTWERFYNEILEPTRILLRKIKGDSK